MFLGVLNTGKKGFLSFIILVHIGVLYNGKFVLTEESWLTNAVVITRVLCIKFYPRAVSYLVLLRQNCHTEYEYHKKWL